MKIKTFIFLGAALTLLLSGCTDSDDGPAPTTRRYFVQIEEVDWDFAPEGRNMIKDRGFDEDESVFVAGGDDRLGAVYRKAIYVEYADSSFTATVAPRDGNSLRGIVGPILRGVVGDTLEVTVRNAGSYPYSLHPHGVFYDPASEGIAPIAPGETYTYQWTVPERAGPGPNDPSSIAWLYHSHADSIADTNAGLVGAIVVTAPDSADEQARPIDVDREFVTLFTVHDENQSRLAADNFARLSEPPDEDDEEFAESNLMHSMNGYVYGNGPVPSMRVGDRVRWYLLATGTEVDLHTPHWHGATVLDGGHRTDVVELLPASMKTVDMIPDSPGTWLYHCHVNDHIAAGMIGRYQVTP